MKNKVIMCLFVSVLFVATSYIIKIVNQPKEFNVEEFYDLLTDSGIVEKNEYLNEHLLETRKIIVTTDINPNSSKKIISSLLYLNSLDEKSPIDLYILSSGGYYDDAFAIVDIIKSLGAPVNTYAIGRTESAATIVLASGTGRRKAYENSLIMVHDNLDKKEKGEYSYDNIINDRLKYFWGKNARLPQEWFSKAGDEAYYLTSKKALQLGIIDEIIRNKKDDFVPPVHGSDKQ